MRFLLYMYYMHPGYRTSICGKKCAYYIRIFYTSAKCGLRVGLDKELCKTTELIKIPFGVLTCGSKEPHTRWGSDPP